MVSIVAFQLRHFNLIILFIAWFIQIILRAYVAMPECGGVNLHPKPLHITLLEEQYFGEYLPWYCLPSGSAIKEQPCYLGMWNTRNRLDFIHSKFKQPSRSKQESCDKLPIESDRLLSSLQAGRSSTDMSTILVLKN